MDNTNFEAQKDWEWKLAESEVLESANIICCTLNMAGSSRLRELREKIDYLIIDEAC